MWQILIMCVVLLVLGVYFSVAASKLTREKDKSKRTIFIILGTILLFLFLFLAIISLFVYNLYIQRHTTMPISMSPIPNIKRYPSVPQLSISSGEPYKMEIPEW